MDINLFYFYSTYNPNDNYRLLLGFQRKKKLA
jgi:hypothetical protein